MKQRRRIYYSEIDKALMWDRWQQGDTLHAIARLFDRGHSSVRRILLETGGIRPPQRRRSRRALSLSEREEISRGVVAGHSIRAIAASLGRAPSTVSGRLVATVVVTITGPVKLTKPRGIGHIGRSAVNWWRTARWHGSWRESSSSTGHRTRSPAG